MHKSDRSKTKKNIGVVSIYEIYELLFFSLFSIAIKPHTQFSQVKAFKWIYNFENEDEDEEKCIKS